MRPYARLSSLSNEEIRKLHNAMISILSTTGMVFEHEEICSLLEEYGALREKGSFRVRFPKQLIERFLEDSEKVEFSPKPDFSGFAGIYQGMHLNPGTNDFEPFTEESLIKYVALGNHLSGVRSVNMQNLPIAEGDPLEPLELVLFCHQHGAQDNGGIQSTDLCPYLYDMYEVIADDLNKPLKEVFKGEVFLVSPLKLAKHEADQLMFFHNKGLQLVIPNMITMGGTGPVTIAGTVALSLAERVGTGILKRVLYGHKRWALGGSLAPLDMRSMIQPYGRPEMVLANMMTADLARYYGVHYGAHSGLSDAKVPSNEAGVQKVMGAYPFMLAGIHSTIEAGLLSIDEVLSPIQMIIDNEIIESMQRIKRGCEVSDETIGLETIDEAGPGGVFTGSMHTAMHFAEEIWQPQCWSRSMLQGWRAGSRMSDIDYAYEIWQSLEPTLKTESALSDEAEKTLRNIIKKASQGVENKEEVNA